MSRTSIDKITSGYAIGPYQFKQATFDIEQLSVAERRVVSGVFSRPTLAKMIEQRMAQKMASYLRKNRDVIPVSNQPLDVHFRIVGIQPYFKRRSVGYGALQQQNIEPYYRPAILEGYMVQRAFRNVPEAYRDRLRTMVVPDGRLQLALVQASPRTMLDPVPLFLPIEDRYAQAADTTVPSVPDTQAVLNGRHDDVVQGRQDAVSQLRGDV